MAARANWKGHLRLSLVSCSVGLYPAVSTSAHLKCHTINRETGNRIKQLIVDSVTEEPVDREDQIKGCEVAKDELVPIEGDELDEIALESTHTINIEAFCRRSEVDERYLDRPYYLAAEDKVSREAFAVIRDAMKKKGMAGLGRLVIYKRERIVLLEPYGKGLLATLLRYHDEIRSPTAYFEDMPDGTPTDEMRSLAEELIERATRKFDPKTFEDRYEGALIALVQGKASKSGKRSKATKAAAKTSGNVVNLMEALKRSIASEKSGAPRSEGRKAGTKAPARSASGSTARKATTRKSASRKKAA
ncbi:Ku protein [Methylobacterium gnaphalii]|uniref:Non-homologous end joining protein Ku n=1 Tax=Methylobacterium gnaphalii TaxID=1010610 RepID=A0A512JR34_9HYPH|nr:Ku protein [Methylobacterium gnaphalii]GEP12428.1 non-homologous end joining protein Ku [Methylobacterium gnaphalii]GJD71759.1 Non-homologous end joining protein Ku [Methylobacterium gnaphalii]GLS48856.1 non-homologous end joining protein Ku [Methylobacterium gnaphalii]